MNKTNIQPDEVLALSSKLKGWADQFSSIASNLKNGSQSLSGWNDPQYEMYIENIKNLHKQMEMNARNLHYMAEATKKMAEETKRTAADYQRRQRQFGQ